MQLFDSHGLPDMAIHLNKRLGKNINPILSQEGNRYFVEAVQIHNSGGKI